MTTVRIALANLPFPRTPEDAVARAVAAIAGAGSAGAQLVCFPECYVPGYRGLGHVQLPPDAAFLDRAWVACSDAAAAAQVAVVLATERIVDGALLATALVIDPTGRRLGFQDKVQLDPSEDTTYTPGEERRVFTVGALMFGVVIVRGSREHVPREGHAVPRGEKQLLHRKRELRERRIADHLGGREPRRLAAGLPTLRRSRPAPRGPRPGRRDRVPRVPVSDRSVEAFTARVALGALLVVVLGVEFRTLDLAQNLAGRRELGRLDERRRVP